MKQTIRDSMIIRGRATLAAAAVCLLLGSCASTTNTPPPPGSAIIDATPDPESRERVAGIALVSINGKSVQGTRCVIKPGLNTVKTRFSWPQGQDQQADLRFYATSGTVYDIHYAVYPPFKEFKSRVGGGMINSLGEAGDPMGAIVGTILLGPPAAVIGIGERISHGVDRNSASATHIDLMVIAQHSSQGIVRKVRAYPDGRVDEKPWGSVAQMQVP